MTDRGRRAGVARWRPPWSSRGSSVCRRAPRRQERLDDPVRILIVGDSITQGSAGDWTWRYRLWQHLTEHGVSVDFVGPRDDLWDNVTSQFGSQAYVDPAFDQDHAARWGDR